MAHLQAPVQHVSVRADKKIQANFRQAITKYSKNYFRELLLQEAFLNSNTSFCLFSSNSSSNRHKRRFKKNKKVLRRWQVGWAHPGSLWVYTHPTAGAHQHPDGYRLLGARAAKPPSPRQSQSGAAQHWAASPVVLQSP